MTFEQYLEACDEVMWATYGVSIEDIADYLWRDAYDNDMRPQVAVEDAIDNDGTWVHW